MGVVVLPVAELIGRIGGATPEARSRVLKTLVVVVLGFRQREWFIGTFRFVREGISAFWTSHFVLRFVVPA